MINILFIPYEMFFHVFDDFSTFVALGGWLEMSFSMRCQLQEKINFSLSFNVKFPDADLLNLLNAVPTRPG